MLLCSDFTTTPTENSRIRETVVSKLHFQNKVLHPVACVHTSVSDESEKAEKVSTASFLWFEHNEFN